MSASRDSKQRKGKVFLMLGNGYDIDRGLPTKYSDFLELCDCFISLSHLSCYKIDTNNFYKICLSIFDKYMPKTFFKDNSLDESIDIDIDLKSLLGELKLLSQNSIYEPNTSEILEKFDQIFQEQCEVESTLKVELQKQVEFSHFNEIFNSFMSTVVPENAEAIEKKVFESKKNDVIKDIKSRYSIFSCFINENGNMLDKFSFGNTHIKDERLIEQGSNLFSQCYQLRRRFWMFRDLIHNAENDEFYNHYLLKKLEITVNVLFLRSILLKELSFFIRFSNLIEENTKDFSTFLSNIYENRWIRCFLDRYQNNVGKNNNWVDFEAEIKHCIVFLQNNLFNNGTIVVDSENGYLDFIKEYCEIQNHGNEIDICYPIDGDANSLAKILDSELKFDLEKLCKAFELFVCYIVNRLQPQNESKALVNIEPNGVISFNYSNTYERTHSNLTQTEYCYIHGKAQISDVSESNIILGIEDSISSIGKDNLYFIGFNKYYQRIYKGTGVLYKKWIEKIKADKYLITFDTPFPHTLYIFGHSIDCCDKDIIKEFVETPGWKIIIFYHNKGRLDSIIKNLVRIIGRDELLKYTYAVNPKIEFKLQP